MTVHPPAPRGVLAVFVALLLGCGGQETDQQAERPQMTAPAVPTALIVAPADGDTLAGPDVQVDLAVENITLAAAGMNEPGTGHLHLFVNHDLTPEGEVIPMGDGIVHLGRPQSGHLLEALEPGAYTIIAVLGDWAHVRIPGARTDTVRIVVP